MRNSEHLTKSLKHFHYTLFLGVAVMAITSWGMPNISVAQTTPAQEKVQLMFVQTAEDIKVDAVIMMVRA